MFTTDQEFVFGFGSSICDCFVFEGFTIQPKRGAKKHTTVLNHPGICSCTSSVWTLTAHTHTQPVLEKEIAAQRAVVAVIHEFNVTMTREDAHLWFTVQRFPRRTTEVRVGVWRRAQQR